ncbi:LacI family DNA-binding transcriptional regulator [Vibrio panuliri]|uniref:LacI family DNA-binding transcriptional regulator n=1 Tax=Vibrio panuliri TaxID=1381081 RepID=UPI001CE32FE1|nr:LacI family DNA-binding transcriptional regulator [Vibrio panuliri]
MKLTKIKVSMGKVRIIDVANHAGVSKSTISQYLNGRYKHMAESTRERIKLAISELDYVPNPIARSLKTDKTKTIGVVVRDVAGFHSSQVIRGVDDYCKKHGYNVVIYNTDFAPESEAQSLKSLKEMCVDGIIIASSGKNPDLLDQYRQQGFPLVEFQIEYQPSDKYVVVSDYEKAAFDATEYLIELGHKNICLITQTFEGIQSRQERIQGFQRALDKHAIKHDQSNILFWSRKDGFESSPSALLRSAQAPSAFFTQHLAITTELLKDLESNKVTVPNDVSLLGFDELPMAEFLKVPVTVIKQDPHRIGVESAKTLMALINNKKPRTKKIIVPCKLIARQSCQTR